MSEAHDTRLMDIEPGGENTTYESQKVFTENPKKSEGQFGASTHAASTKEMGDNKAAKAQKDGSEEADGSGGAPKKVDTSGCGSARRQMGYGEGSGVGG